MVQHRPLRRAGTRVGVDAGFTGRIGPWWRRCPRMIGEG
jgi:hypothetical protein